MVDKFSNSLNLLEFSGYIEGQHLEKFKPEINENYLKFKETFGQLWNQIQSISELKMNLIRDRKFDAVFDQTFLEFESFYIFLTSQLKVSILDLNAYLNTQLANY